MDDNSIIYILYVFDVKNIIYIYICIYCLFHYINIYDGIPCGKPLAVDGLNCLPNMRSTGQETKGVRRVDLRFNSSDDVRGMSNELGLNTLWFMHTANNKQRPEFEEIAEGQMKHVQVHTLFL